MSIKSKEVAELISNWLLERLKASGCNRFRLGNGDQCNPQKSHCKSSIFHE